MLFLIQQKPGVHGDTERQYVSVGHISDPKSIRFPHSTNFPSRRATSGGFPAHDHLGRLAGHGCPWVQRFGLDLPPGTQNVSRLFTFMGSLPPIFDLMFRDTHTRPITIIL